MEEHEHHEQREHEAKAGPQIYVASLADYTNGHLHGVWIDADQDAEDIQTAIQAMLTTSPTSGAEEWAIHDHTGFGAFPLSEYESVDVVARLAGGITEYGTAFAHWATIVGSDNQDGLDAFSAHYRGRWHSLAEYAEDWLDDLLAPGELGPAWLRPYVRIDYEALGQALSHDLEVVDDGAGVEVFERWEG